MRLLTQRRVMFAAVLAVGSVTGPSAIGQSQPVAVANLPNAAQTGAQPQVD